MLRMPFYKFHVVKPTLGLSGGTIGLRIHLKPLLVSCRDMEKLFHFCFGTCCQHDFPLITLGIPSRAILHNPLLETQLEL